MTREEIVFGIIKQKIVGIDNIKKKLKCSIVANNISVSENVFQQMLTDILYESSKVEG